MIAFNINSGIILLGISLVIISCAPTSPQVPTPTNVVDLSSYTDEMARADAAVFLRNAVAFNDAQKKFYTKPRKLRKYEDIQKYTTATSTSYISVSDPRVRVFNHPRATDFLYAALRAIKVEGVGDKVIFTLQDGSFFHVYRPKTMYSREKNMNLMTVNYHHLDGNMNWKVNTKSLGRVTSKGFVISDKARVINTQRIEKIARADEQRFNESRRIQNARSERMRIAKEDRAERRHKNIQRQLDNTRPDRGAGYALYQGLKKANRDFAQANRGSSSSASRTSSNRSGRRGVSNGRLTLETKARYDERQKENHKYALANDSAYRAKWEREQMAMRKSNERLAKAERAEAAKISEGKAQVKRQAAIDAANARKRKEATKRAGRQK